MPTVLSSLDIPVPYGLGGENVTPLWKGREPGGLRRRLIFGQRKHPEVKKFLMGRIDAFIRINEVGTKLPELVPEEIERLRALGYL